MNIAAWINRRAARRPLEIGPGYAVMMPREIRDGSIFKSYGDSYSLEGGWGCADHFDWAERSLQFWSAVGLGCSAVECDKTFNKNTKPWEVN